MTTPLAILELHEVSGIFDYYLAEYRKLANELNWASLNKGANHIIPQMYFDKRDGYLNMAMIAKKELSRRAELAKR